MIGLQNSRHFLTNKSKIKINRYLLARVLISRAWSQLHANLTCTNDKKHQPAHENLAFIVQTFYCDELTDDVEIVIRKTLVLGFGYL